MYIVRDIFNLKYGHFRPVKAMMEESIKMGMMPNDRNMRVLSDFTGNAYRFIIEFSFESLSDYEKELSKDMSKPEFQEWYKKFIEHVNSGEREILKVIM